MKIHTLDTARPITANPSYSDLPDEASFMLVSEREALAKKCGQAFKLEMFNWKKHQRALCVGFSEGENAIALFYVSDAGLYAWCRIDHIHIEREKSSTNWTSLAIENGMAYWFTPSARGDNYYKAVIFGLHSNIGKRYQELHQLPESKTNSSSNKHSKKDDDGNGSPPANHPQDDFALLTSFDEFGL